MAANVWRADLNAILDYLEAGGGGASARLYRDRVILPAACSGRDLELETALDAELKSWLAFATQKLDELVVLACGVGGPRWVADA